jgi:dihydroflavonol-4-reductase
LAVERVPCDITDRDCLDAALDGVHTVFHCAAKIAITHKMERGMLVANIEGTKNILEAALSRGVRRFVHFSSIHALSSEPEDGVIDETRSLVNHHPRMLYDFSKAEGERLALEAVKNGLDAVIVNPTAVIGPFDFKPSLLGEFVLALCRGKIPALVKGGFNWVDVRDVVAGALAAEKKGVRGERYLLGGHWESVDGLAALIGRLSGKKTQTGKLPHWIAHLGVPFLALSAAISRRQPLYTHDSVRTLLHHRRVSSDKAKRELGYSPRPLEETIGDTLSWFREKGYLK